MVGVDPRFPTLLRHLRHDRGLSLRDLARRIHYSHSYLWDLETGRKQPTLELAAALDIALTARGALTDLVTDDTAVPVDPTPMTDAIQALETHRAQLEDVARQGWSPDGDTETRALAVRCAQVASWLYDVFVRSRPPLVRQGARRYSRRLRAETGASPFRIEVLQQGRTPRSECRSITEQPAPAHVARELNIGPSDLVVCRENRYYADDEPLQIGITYIPISIAGPSSKVKNRALGIGSLYSQLADLGYQIARIRECVHTRLPTPAEAMDLRIPPGVPVLCITHTSFDDHGLPFEVSCFTMRADLGVINYEMPVED